MQFSIIVYILINNIECKYVLCVLFLVIGVIEVIGTFNTELAKLLTANKLTLNIK